MVVDQLSELEVDVLFAALADSTRRDIVRRAATDEHSVSRLAQHYAMSFAAVQKHVAILERAGLVTKRRRGREQLVSSNADTLARARLALEQLEALWRQRLDSFAAVLEEAPPPAPPTDPQTGARP